MPSSILDTKPGLATFLEIVRSSPVESSIEYLISLLKRRQIRSSSSCAVATAQLLRQVVKTHRVSDVSRLIVRVQQVGQQLISARSKELAIGNIVRRVLGVIRDEAEEEREWENTAIGGAGRPADTPRDDELTPTDVHVDPLSAPTDTSTANALPNANASKDIRAELIEGIDEIVDELDQVDDQIAGYALEHIHSNEVILTHTSSVTVQKFLLKAAAKRKFTVFHAESYPNDHECTHATVTGYRNGASEDEMTPELFHKPLATAGINVILVPDSAIFAVMSRVNKVILGANVVLANGGLITAVGSKTIAKAARMHRTPVVFLSGIYQISPENPSNIDSLIEFGSASNVFAYEDGESVRKFDVENPLDDYVPPDLVDLFITNLGGHAPFYLDRIISDHYRSEDMKLSNP